MQARNVKSEFEVDEYTLALWHFNEGSGQLVYDSSSHGNNGTLGPTSNVESNDPSWTAGFTGQLGDCARSMDDWYDYVLVPDNPDNSLDLNLSNQFTIEFWAYSRQVSRSDRGFGYHWNTFVTKRPYADTTGYQICQCSYYPYLSANFYDTSSQGHGFDVLPPPTLNWTHVMFAYDGTFLRLFYNGILQAQQGIGSYFVAGNADPLSIGKSLAADDPWMDAVDGVIDEVRISSIDRSDYVTIQVDSLPSEVEFTLNGSLCTTPWNGSYVQNTTLDIVMPENYTIDSKVWLWNKWSDENPSRSRTVLLETDIALTGEYFDAGAGPVHNLNTGLNYSTIQEAIDAPETLDGHTLYVEPGGYGGVRIYKSISLLGAGRESTSIGSASVWSASVLITASNVQIANFTMGGLYIYNSLNDTVYENSISAYGPGPQYCFTAELSSGLNISRNHFETFVLLQSNDNTINENNIVSPSWLIPGMWIQQSSRNKISRNNITAEGLGMWFDTACNLNMVFGNRISSGRAYPLLGCYGVEVDSSAGNVFFENCIMTYSVGARLASTSTNNKFYHNNFINNTEQARCNFSIMYSWDDGYPSGGNYWSDYNGTDVFSGPYQNETGSDGIGDIAYVINPENIDHYPLFKGLHDIGITDAETSKAGCLPMPTVGKGNALNATVTIVNYGITTEARTLILYANTTAIHTVPGLILTSGNSTTVIIECNTTELDYGNYTLTAYCEPDPSESNTADNTCCCWIIITIPGDLNGDYAVDIYDAIRLAGSFNSNSAHSNWNVNADINNDLMVDIYDAIILANHYNQQYP